MDFVSIRIITERMVPLIAFYEAVTECTARRFTDDFAEIVTQAGRLAIAHRRTMALFGNPLPGRDRSAVILEFRAEDVDATFERLGTLIGDTLVQPPTTMPWGNRSLLCRDPDGTLVNIFAPVSEDAIRRFAA